MKKKKFTLLTMAAIVLALGLASVYLLNTQPADEDGSSSGGQDTSIISLDATVEYIDVENESGNYSIIADEGVREESSEASGSTGSEKEEDGRQWKIEDLGSVPQYQSMYSDLVMLMTDLSADLVLDSPGELSVYGLDQPSKTTAYYDDGSSLTLLVGNLTPDESGYYCKLDDSDTIYVLSSTNGEKFLRSILDYVDLQVIPTIEAVTYSTESDESEVISTLNVTNISIKRNGYDDVTITAEDNALVRNGVEIDKDMSSKLLSAISGITAESAAAVSPSSEQLEEYGLASPTATISYTVSGETYTLTVGSGIESEVDESLEIDVEAGIGSYYVMIEGTDVVYAVSKDYLPWLNLEFD